MEGAEKNIEVSAPTVEEAIDKGLAKLGKAEDEVKIEVLGPGSRGVLGIGAKEALVRLSFVESEEEEEEDPPPPEQSVAQIARETLHELLIKMKVKASVTIRPEEEIPQDEDAPPFILDVVGDDLGDLIGRRGQTLQALQYITGLIVSREVQGWVNLVVDVERYKARREKALRQLAQRMAERVAFGRQPVALEPMPPNERRIIHLALRDHPIVITQSVGKGEQRKVTIVPKGSVAD
ncbi:MAG: protein jag [Anaerolineales bacterium]|nr:protein jag [Anaerolineales bacterium]